MQEAHSLQPLRSPELDFLIAEFNSMRQELVGRWTMLYTLGALSWVVVAGSFAAIYTAPRGPFYDLSLVGVPALLLLGSIFGGEVAWMAALHRSCSNIEKEMLARMEDIDPARLRTLLWHTQYGQFLFAFPGASILVVSSSTLFLVSVFAFVLYPFPSALCSVGWSQANVEFAQGASLIAAITIVIATWLYARHVQSRE